MSFFLNKLRMGWRSRLAGLCMSLCVGSTALAQNYIKDAPRYQDISYRVNQEYDARLTALENSSDVQNLDARLRALEAGSQSTSCCPQPQGCCPQPCKNCCPIGTAGFIADPGYGLVGGLSFVVAKPYIQGQQAIYDTTNGAVRAFDYDFQLSPRIWLGYVDPNGFGVRLQYWRFYESAGISQTGPLLRAATFSSSVPVPFNGTYLDAVNDTLNVGSSLRLQIADLDGTYRTRLGRIQITAGLGIRYLAMQQKYDATTSFSSLSSRIGFDGLGPSVMFMGRAPIGSTGFAIVGNLRLANVFGTKRQQIDFEGLTTMRRKTSESVQMFESQSGLEWGINTARGGRLYVQGTVESDLYANCGNLFSDVQNLAILGLNGTIGLTY